jgi:hypothetical protein
MRHWNDKNERGCVPSVRVPISIGIKRADLQRLIGGGIWIWKRASSAGAFYFGGEILIAIFADRAKEKETARGEGNSLIFRSKTGSTNACAGFFLFTRRGGY